MTDIVVFGLIDTSSPSPQHVWLRPFTGVPKARCLVCLSKSVHTEYHEATVVGMCKEARDAILALADAPEEVHDETTQHLCRGCFSCGYTWSEVVAGPGDLEEIKRKGDSDEDD